MTGAQDPYAGMRDTDGNFLPQYMTEDELRQEMERARDRKPARAAACRHELQARETARASSTRLGQTSSGAM
jgi:hypothetical protein